jgi:hypothetical protein
MGIQKDPLRAPAISQGSANPYLPAGYEPTGVGGNSCLTNQNEQAVIEDTWESVPVQGLTGGMFAEDDSHCQGVYRRGDV